MTMRESIELNERNGVKHTPELKEGDPAVIARVFGSQAQYAQRFADELRTRASTRRTRSRSPST